MNSEDKRQVEACPEMETLVAYVDGALSAEEIDTLKLHVAGCDRCYDEIVSLQQELKASAVLQHKAPPDLVVRGNAIGATGPARFSYRHAYAAAVLALVFAGLWRANAPAPRPLSVQQAMAALNGLSDRQGAATLTLNIPEDPALSYAAKARTAEQHAFYAGVAMSNIEYLLYREDARQVVRQQASSLEKSLAALIGDITASKPLAKALAAQSDMDQRSLLPPWLETQQAAADAIRHLGSPVETYFYLGLWYQSLYITARVMQQDSQSPSVLPGLDGIEKVGQILAEQLRAATPHSALLPLLAQLDRNLAAKNTESVLATLAQIFQSLSQS